MLSMKTAPFLTDWKAPLAPERDVAHVVVVADAAEHEVLVLGGVRRRRRGLAAVLLGPGLGLGAVAVVDGEIVPALLAEMPRHRVAHHAQADPRHFRHVASSSDASSSEATNIGRTAGCQAAIRSCGCAQRALSRPDADGAGDRSVLVSTVEGTPMMAAPMRAAAAAMARRAVLTVTARLLGLRPHGHARHMPAPEPGRNYPVGIERSLNARLSGIQA